MSVNTISPVTPELVYAESTDSAPIAAKKTTMRSHYLSSLFAPASIVMFGASDRPDTVGQVVYRNLLKSGFKGPIYAVNPQHDSIQGQRAYPNVASIGQPVDLAVVATPAKAIPGIVEASEKAREGET